MIFAKNQPSCEERRADNSQPRKNVTDEFENVRTSLTN